MQLMAEVVSFQIHYNSHWNKNDDQNWRYEGGGIKHIRNQDIDYLSFHELLSYRKDDLGYISEADMWFKISKINGTMGLEQIVDDKNVENMLNYNKGDEYIILYYVGIDPLIVIDYGAVLRSSVLQNIGKKYKKIIMEIRMRIWMILMMWLTWLKHITSLVR